MRKIICYLLVLNSFVLFAQDKVERLAEIELNVPKKTKKLTIGKVKKKSKVRMKMNLKGKDRGYSRSRFFAYDSIYQQTPFIEEIKILTRSNVRNAKFEVYLHQVKEDGRLGEVLHEKPFIGIAKKRKKKTKISLSENPIEFPENGVFVVVRWIYSEENLYEVNTYEVGGSKGSMELLAPDFFTFENHRKRAVELNSFLVLTN